MDRRTYPDSPIVGVGAVVLRGGSVLLVKRGNPPLSESWSIPGGRVHEGENLKAWVLRYRLIDDHAGDWFQALVDDASLRRLSATPGMAA